MKLNPLKCELLCISNKRTPLKFDYKINDFQLPWCNSVKYLGIHINSTLSWNTHCSIITAKATRVLNIIHHNLFGCSKESKHRAFSALMLPILEYACQVWNPHTQKNIKQLQAIEHRGARWICGARYDRLNFRWSPPSADCCVTLNWLPLSVRRKFFTILTVHDILHSHICLDFNNYFTISSIPTRSHSLSLYCKQASVNSYRFSFFVNSVFIWNCIPYTLLLISNRNSFKSKLYSYLSSNYFN